jgi:pantoate--beta-alanine ligase
MGALHQGHLALILRARKLAGKTGTVAVSLFVNPTQFGPNEDLSRYPRTLKQDQKLCRDNGVDLLFMPSPADIYPADFSTYIEETKLQGFLCGQSRPGHFRGVCTIVGKLFNLFSPDLAVFGEKDFQQLAIIRKMVRDLDFNVKIVPVATVREADGLAMSSRNRYLSPQERAQAPVIRQALLEARSKAGRLRPAALKSLVAKRIAPLARIDYVEVVDADSLQPVSKQTRQRLIAVAAFFGNTRLIDNILLD